MHITGSRKSVVPDIRILFAFDLLNMKENSDDGRGKIHISKNAKLQTRRMHYSAQAFVTSLLWEKVDTCVNFTNGKTLSTFHRCRLE